MLTQSMPQQVRALDTAEMFPSSDMVPVLLTYIMTRPIWDNTRQAFSILAQIGDRHSADACVEVFRKSTDSMVRSWAMSCLGEMRSCQVVEIALECLDIKKEDTPEFPSAITALGVVGAQQAVPVLISMYNQTQKDRTKALIVRALCNMNQPEAEAFLTTVTADLTDELREEVAHKVGRGGINTGVLRNMLKKGNARLSMIAGMYLADVLSRDELALLLKDAAHQSGTRKRGCLLGVACYAGLEKPFEKPA